jgi:hypothetical protein
MCLRGLYDVSRVNESDPKSASSNFKKHVKLIKEYPHFGNFGALDGVSFLQSFLPYAEEFWAYHCGKSISNHNDSNSWETTLTSWRLCQTRQTSEYHLWRETSSFTIDSICDRMGYSSATRSPSKQVDDKVDYIQWIFMIACKCTLSFRHYKTILRISRRIRNSSACRNFQQRGPEACNLIEFREIGPAFKRSMGPTRDYEAASSERSKRRGYGPR